jgi:hypothetical protein
MEFVFFTLFHTFETERSDLKKNLRQQRSFVYTRSTHVMFFFHFGGDSSMVPCRVQFSFFTRFDTLQR